MIGPHPHKLDLGAWFDGESADGVGAHVARCGRCGRRVSEMAHVRSWLRAQPFVAMSDETEKPRAAARHGWGRPVVAAGLLLVAYLAAPELTGRDRNRALDGPLTAQSGDRAKPPVGPAARRSANPSTPSSPRSSPAGAAAPPGPQTARSTRPATPAPASLLAPAKSALNLGLVIPFTGPLAREGAEVRDVVERRIAAANTSGGVAGLPIELEVAPSEDPAAVAAMAGRVNAIVGGFGADVPTTTPWLFPADPAITGPNVVPAEPSARAVGERLAGNLRIQGLLGLVGVVVGSGPDAALAAGLASKTPVTTVSARKGSTCLTELATLRRSGALILAVAGDTDLVASCVRAAVQSSWQPRLGLLVPPSAAYAGIGALPEAAGTRTVLALPWPTSSAPGAARFRASTVSQSYRALVSYAATELAIDVARQTGAVSLASIAGRSWRSDLLEVDGITERKGTVMDTFLGSWLAVP